MFSFLQSVDSSSSHSLIAFCTQAQIRQRCPPHNLISQHLSAIDKPCILSTMCHLLIILQTICREAVSSTTCKTQSSIYYTNLAQLQHNCRCRSGILKSSIFINHRFKILSIVRAVSFNTTITEFPPYLQLRLLEAHSPLSSPGFEQWLCRHHTLHKY